ncbi:MAG: cytochrome c oxidase assembly protein [Acidimicrobiales bacterium]
MTGGAAQVRSRELPARSRGWVAVGGLVVLVLALVPPLSSWARHTEVAWSVQFSVLALVVPCLLVVGAPWRRLGLAAPRAGPGARRPRFLDRLAEGRHRHPELVRSLGFLALDLAVVVAWQTPGAVDAVLGHAWLVVPEALSLVAAGTGLWLECVESPPLVPRGPRPQRALVAALAMWTMWTMAYLAGFSHVSWYHGFTHRAGDGLSAAADQQFSTAVLWAVAAAVFLPVIFSNVVTWLRDDEDPDDELYRLVKTERHRGWASPPLGGLGGAPTTERGPGAG